MKTTIDIPEKELSDAIKFTGAKTKKEAVVTALADFNRRNRMARLVEFGGKFTHLRSNDEIESLEIEESEQR